MSSFTKGFIGIFSCILIYVGVICYKSTETILIDGDKYRKRISSLKIEGVRIDPMRGFIFADNGELLAGSLPEYDVFLDFKHTTRPDPVNKKINIPPEVINQYFGPNGEGSKALAELFPEKTADQWGKEVTAAYKKRLPNYKLLNAIPYLDYKRLRQKPYFSMSNYRCGVIANQRAHRYRPYGENRMASTTIGDVFARKDTLIGKVLYKGYGRSGIEQAFDSLLRGVPGQGYKQKIRGKLTEITTKQPEAGANVHTTINVEIQDILDRTLHQRIIDLHAAGGWAAVMDVKTGQIKAISNLKRISDTECIEDHNHLFEDLVDPGSTFKTASYIVLLEEGKITPDTIIDTQSHGKTPGVFNYHGKDIRDDHACGVVTADEAICQSSNVAIAKMVVNAYENNPQAYLDALHRIGFLDDLKLRGEFPKAQAARKRKVKDRTWSNVSLGQISYGYEGQIPGIYILNLYNAIANGGKLMRPYIIDHVEKDGEILWEQEPQVINKSICSKKTLAAVHHALLGVVEHGTASANGWTQAAQSKKLLIAGKTGTAQRYNEATGGYTGVGHNVSFAGYFPADDPQYSAIVVINTQGSGYGRPGGGYMAGPVFRQLAEEVYARHCYRSVKNIPQDTLNPKNPQIKHGMSEAIYTCLEELDFDTNLTLNKKAMAKAVAQTEESGKLRYDLEPINEQKQLMPNVIGMGAGDALYVLEKCGLKVNLAGKGKVVGQSIPKGSRYQKGQYISLTLR